MVASLFAYFMDNPSQRYTIYHIWKMYSIIVERGPVGRKELAEILDLGEGTVRTIMEKMKEDGSIELSRRGASITDQGQRRLSSLGIEIRPIEIDDITLGEIDCAVLARCVAPLVKDGCEQRDDAVKAGAIGATTLIAIGGRMVFPGDEKYPDQSTSDKLNQLFRIRDGDALIIGTANSYDVAEKGAVTAALRLHAPSFKCGKENGLLSEFMDPEDVKCLAIAIHELVGYMPVAIRTKNQLGVLCEEGLIVSDRYTGPYLEEALRTGKTLRTVPKIGLYTGVPVICVPIQRKGKAVLVIGLVDLTKLSIHDLMGRIKRDGLQIQYKTPDSVLIQ